MIKIFITDINCSFDIELVVDGVDNGIVAIGRNFWLFLVVRYILTVKIIIDIVPFARLFKVMYSLAMGQGENVHHLVLRLAH